MATMTEKLEWFYANGKSEILRKTRQEVENELSDRQGMWCICGKLATGLHESHCKRFQNKVLKETIVKLEYILPKELK